MLIDVIANDLLTAFPYHDNYIELIRMELNALKSMKAAGYNLSRFAIVGSGPLPLTSLSISEYLKGEDDVIHCYNIDQNEEAISSSEDVCRAIGHNDETMHFQCADACDPEIELNHVDAVFLAALVGTCSEQKRDIVANIVSRMKPGALIVLRSARKSTLCYCRLFLSSFLFLVNRRTCCRGVGFLN